MGCQAKSATLPSTFAAAIQWPVAAERMLTFPAGADTPMYSPHGLILKCSTLAGARPFPPPVLGARCRLVVLTEPDSRSHIMREDLRPEAKMRRPSGWKEEV